MLGYWDDTKTAKSDPVVGHLKAFLEKIIRDTKVKKIQFVAHSMGNQLSAKALAEIAAEAPGLTSVIGEIIDASPDVATADMERMVKAISGPDAEKAPGKGAGFTIYASRNDYALFTSGLVNWESRAGYVNGTQPVIILGVDSIDVTNAGNYFSVNHDLYASSPLLVADMRRIFSTGQRPPDQRSPAFEAVTVKEGTYWRLKGAAAQLRLAEVLLAPVRRTMSAETR